MNGERPNRYFIVAWYFISPVFILIIWFFNWYQYEPITYGKYKFSTGAHVFGWCIALISIIAIPIAAGHSIVKASGKSFIEVFTLFHFKKDGRDF